MPSKLPTIVLVPGAWTSPIAYHKLVDALKARLFEVHVPPLPTNNGCRPPNSSHEADVKAVRDVVVSLINDGKEVSMCMHSYGGVVGTNAVAGLARKDRQAENLPGGVVHLFYLASFMLAQGQTMRSVVEKVGLVGRGSLVKIEDDGTWFPTEAIWGMYHDLEPEDQDEQVNQLVYSNICCMSSATTYEAWRYIPTTYVRTSEDRWNPPQFQDFCQANAENAGADVDVVEFKSGHSVYAKYPNELADLVAKVSNAT